MALSSGSWADFGMGLVRSEEGEGLFDLPFRYFKWVSCSNACLRSYKSCY